MPASRIGFAGVLGFILLAAALGSALSPYQTGLLTQMLIYGIFAMSLDLLMGFAGAPTTQLIDSTFTINTGINVGGVTETGTVFPRYSVVAVPEDVFVNCGNLPQDINTIMADGRAVLALPGSRRWSPGRFAGPAGWGSRPPVACGCSGPGRSPAPPP